MTESSLDEADAGWRESRANASDTNAHPARDQGIEDDSNPSDEDLLRAFVGPNAEKFVAIHRAQKAKRRKLSFNWVVLLAALPWFLYRKLYLYGACLVLGPIILVTIFPDLSGVSFAGVAGALAVVSNRLYVETADKRIKKLRAIGLPPQDLLERARKAGGTSPAAAAFGTLIMASMIALQILALTLPPLPGCDDVQVRELATRMVTSGLSRRGVESTGLVLTDFQPAGSEDDSMRRICSFSMELGDEKATWYLDVFWANPETGELRASLVSSLDSLRD